VAGYRSDYEVWRRVAVRGIGYNRKQKQSKYGAFKLKAGAEA